MEKRALSELVFSRVKKSGRAKPWQVNSVSRSRTMVLSSMPRDAWEKYLYDQFICKNIQNLALPAYQEKQFGIVEAWR